MPTHKDTAQQVAFLNALTATNRNIALIARAGCGKTTAILRAVDELVKTRPAAEITVCAYNKAIAEEVKAKLIKAGHTNWKTVQAATLHSMGFGLIKFAFKSAIDDKKVQKLVEGLNTDLARSYAPQIATLVRYAKQAAFGFFPDKPIGDVTAWHALADHFDVNGLDDTSEMDEIVGYAQTVYRASLLKTDVIDFDDMILFPLIKNMRVKFGRDYLFLDEAQDLSPARQALARKFLKTGTGRMIIVGDDRQAIYGFSGADADALPNMIAQLNALSLPLSVTWRCPVAVVKEAQRFVPDITAAPTAPEGAVNRSPAWTPEALSALTPRDAILCRNTAPLIKLAYTLIRSGKPCKVEGRAVGEGLKKLTQRWKIKTIDALINRLKDYREREIQKANAKGQENKAEEVADKVDTLLEICSAVLATSATKTVADVDAFIDNLFADGATNVTTLATYHRAKGREWEHVFLFEHAQRCPAKAARQAWQINQENNLAYVAITRAMNTLTYVG
jgi:superfamily I DNA/RNA helicase